VITIKLVSGSEMGQIDRHTITEVGISGLVLMEQAGRRVTESILADYSDLERVLVLAGRGNNGGDGFVISRLLAQAGIEVKTILLGDKEQLTGDAKVNLNILEELGYQVEEITRLEGVQSLQSDFKRADLLVDALLGTGIKGELRGLFPAIIKLVNQVRTSVVSVDIPSGVEADSGLVKDVAIKAQQTITFALPKLGLILYPGAEFVGQLKIVEIGIPQQVIEQQEITTNLITSDLVAGLFPARADKSHKGDYGKLLLVAGSTGMTGAASLVAQSSLKMGAGLVTVGVPQSLNPTLEVKLTEVMTYPLAETDSGTVAVDALEQVNDLMSSRDVLAVGPGLGVEEEVEVLVNQLLAELEKPIVIDADGLNAINDLAILKARTNATILTPHPGEMSRLIGQPIVEIEKNRLEVAQEFALAYGVTLVLKGAKTVIATPGGKAYVNQTGNSALATGGSGDVLTGLITSLLGQGLTAEDSAIIAVYLHGLAAELGSEELTKYSLLPTDLIDYLPAAIKRIDSL
jgi:NAD(P)H-hydrate epimerase